MKDEKLKLKNIKDLEYDHILSNQNVFLIVFATIIISIVLSDKLPENLTKWSLVLAFILLFIPVLLYSSKKLEDKINEIYNI